MTKLKGQKRFTELAEVYLSNPQYKLMSHSNIARQIFNDYPEITISLKTAQNAMSEIRKSIIVTRQKRNHVSNNFEFNTDEMDCDINIPQSFYQDNPVFVIPDAVSKLLVVGDLHIPFHDVKAIKIAFRYAKDNGCDGVLLNGDTMDFHFASRFMRDPKYRDAEKEMSIGRTFLESLRKFMPDSRIYYKIGNHDQRMSLRIIENTPEYYSLDELKIENLLKLGDFNIEKIDPLAIAEFGKLNLLHGHEFHRYGIHVTYNNLLKSMDNIMFCHYHKTMEYIHTMLKGDVLGSWSVGCLCGLRPEYLPLNNWNLGFAIVTRRGHNGSFEVSNKKIINGRIL